VSVPAAIRSRPARWPLGVATVIAAALGTGLGIALTPDQPARPAPPPPPEPRVGLQSGVAKLPLPAGWKPLGRLSTLPGFDAATAVRAEQAELALDIRRVEHPSLLPAGVVTAAAGDLAEPKPRSLGGRTVWRYELPPAEPGTRLVALSLPTTAGIVTIGCQAAGATADRADAECEKAIGAVRLDGASALAPARETAARIALPATFAQLNRRRRDARRSLAATRSPRYRAAAARRLARSYAGAAAQLRPLAGGDAVRLTATLGALARKHRALAAASLRRKARRAARSGAAIERKERRLAALLAALTRPRAGA
jgi:hypothetical protein